MKKRNLLILFFVLGLLLMMGGAALSAPPGPRGIKQLKRDAVGEFEWTQDPRSHYPSFVRGEVPLATTVQKEADAGKKALAFVQHYADAFGVRNPQSELMVAHTERDSLGMTHVTLQQIYEDVPVYNALMKVHLSADGRSVLAVSNGFVPGIELAGTQPRVSAVEAVDIAQKFLPNGTLIASPKLVVYPGIGSKRSGSSARLSWLVELADDSEPARNVYVVDAVAGTIIDVLSRLYDQADFLEASPAPPSLSTDFDQTEDAWLTYQDEKLGVTVQYPPNWHLYLHTIVGRHRGFDPLLLTSFEVIFEKYGRELTIPPGEAAILISFEDNDLKPGESLADYAWNNLASTEYRLTRKVQTFGSNTFVEMKGEIGTVWLSAKGSNVYSVYIFPGVDESQTETIQHIMSRLKFRERTILIPEEDRGLKAPGQLLPLRSEALQTPAVPPLNMYMPWDDRDGRKHTYNSGPHEASITDWNCVLRDVANMSALDLGMPEDTPVLAVAGGTVVLHEYVTGIGNRVGIDHGSNFSSEYWHLSSIHSSISMNQRIAQGTLLGYSGTAGSGPHLHLDFRRLPNRTPYSAHGISIDRYTAWTYIDSDGKGFNYQGTLLPRRAITSTYKYKECNNVLVKRWITDPITDTITAGDKQKVITSRNLSCPTGQYRAEYYDNRDLNGKPVFTRCEEAPVAKDWGDNGPGHGISNDNFSVRWSGRFNFAQDMYSFLTETDDGVRVWVDGRLIIDAWRDQPPTDHTSDLNLTSGEHLVLVEYYEHGGGATAHLHWWGHTTDSDDNRKIISRQTLWGMIYPESDVDTYYFDAVPGELATIRMTKRILKGLDPYLILYGPDGTELARDDDGGGNQNALIEDLPISQAGRYRIEARSFEGNSAGIYSLSLTLRQPGQPNRQTYDARHETNLPGTLVRSEGQGPTGDRDIDNAHDFASATYDYFWNTFKRDSYDDQGAVLVSTANYGRSYQNAFWNGEQTIYGDNFPVKDVVAHEWTHAVTQHTANLEYRWQSGALNESFSDIFGAMVDREDWLIGEDLPDEILSGRDAIRDLSNPARLGQPAHTDDWVATCTDNEGVHSNSGITNKAYFNIATAIGKDKAERIFYRALTVYLQPTSSLEDARAAALQAAQDLYGADSGEYTAVQDGFNAVGLDGNWNPPPNDCGPCAAVDTLSPEPDGDTLLSDLRAVRDQVFTEDPGRRWSQIYYEHQLEVAWVLLRNSQVRADALAGFRAFDPVFRALLEGDQAAEPVILTPELIAAAERALMGVAENSSPAVREDIIREWERVDPYRFVGWDVRDVWAQLRIEESKSRIYLPLVAPTQ